MHEETKGLKDREQGYASKQSKFAASPKKPWVIAWFSLTETKKQTLVLVGAKQI